MNPYLRAKREQYDAIRTSIEGLQTRAADEKRDLTPDELRSVQDQGEQAKKIAEEIESLTEIETRSRKVAELADSVIGDEDTEQTRSTSTTTAKDRDPGHYRSSVEGGQHSFFADLRRAKGMGDEVAARRLAEHNRALTTGGEGAGIVPPKWLSSEYATIARQTRRAAAAVRHIPIGDDPRSITLPKQSGAVTITEQSTEGTATPSGWPDEYDTDVDTVAPKMTVGKARVTRQMLDASSPAIDQLIYGDLVGAYNSAIEAKVCAAMVAAAGTAVETFATNAAFNATDGPDALVDAQVAVRNARKLPADLLVMNVARYGEALKWKDTTGRPLIPGDSGGPMNVVGVGEVAVDGRIQGLGVTASDGIPSTYPESILVARASDTILFEGSQKQVRYEEPDGPELIRLAFWTYTAVLVRYQGASVKRLVITAAS